MEEGIANNVLGDWSVDDSERFFVYKITNPENGKVYVGATTRPNSRLSGHKHSLKTQVDLPLYKDMVVLGITDFDMEIIEEYPTREDMFEGEIFYIEKYKSNSEDFGYNLSSGGSSGSAGISRSDSWREEHSLRMKGEGNPMWGKTHSTEAREVISKFAKERGISKYMQERAILVNTGAKRTDEARIKISKALTGRKFSEKHITSIKRSKEKFSKGIIVDGVKFPSLREAARSLGIGRDTIRSMINGNKNLLEKYNITEINYA